MRPPPTSAKRIRCRLTVTTSAGCQSLRTASAFRVGRARGTFGPAPHFPERSGRPAPRARTRTGPVGSGVRRDVRDARASRRTRAPTVRQLHDGLEPAFGDLVEHADDAVELLDRQVLQRDATDEIHVAVGTERKARAVHRVVALEQELVEL